MTAEDLEEPRAPRYLSRHYGTWDGSAPSRTRTNLLHARDEIARVPGRNWKDFPAEPLPRLAES